MIAIYHIRKPLLRARGNQWYRDKSHRGQGTFCGEPEGPKDISHRTKWVVWIETTTGTEWQPCARCMYAMAERSHELAEGN